MAFGVIADDLTGALDGGLQLYRKGFTVSVYYSTVEAELSAEQAEIVVLDTESRNVSAQEAVRKTEKTISLLRANRIPVMYKKVDSTLRGNPGVELEVILRSSKFDAALLTPALPRTGRTVRNGVLYVGGVPVADTEFSSDPHSPIESSNIAEIITRNASFDCTGMNRRALSVAAKDPECFLEKRSSPSGLPVFIADAESGTDLARIAEFVSGCGNRVLPCGSAGLLEHLAARLKASHADRRGGDLPIRRLPRPAVRRISGLLRLSVTRMFLPRRSPPVLIISSSMSAVTRRQIEYVVARGRVVRIRPDMQDVFGSDTALEVYSRRVLEALSQGKHVLFDAGGRREELPRGQALVAEQSAALQILLSRFVNDVMRHIPSDELAGLVVTGGETAINVCLSLSACGIRICGEIEPLVPSGTLIGGIARDLPVITKAGGFGSDSVFERACSFLARSRR